MVCCLTAANAWVVLSATPYLYGPERLSELPVNDSALVLGTSRYARDGRRNEQFHARIEAAAALYQAGKVRHLVVSGDNASERHNEPRAMRQALIAAGVPAAVITADYAGFRTLDSIIRMGRVFGQRRFTIVSQEYHNYRAVFIARHHGLQAVAFNAGRGSPRPVRTELRETVARLMAVVDLFVLGTSPRFLGPHEPLQLDG